MTRQHYLFLGDSITDAGHLWESDPRMLGDGFIRRISEHPAFSEAQLVNRGQDGFTGAALLRLVKRMTDLSSFDAITVLIGVNDLPVAYHADPDWIIHSFAQNMEALFALLLSAKIPAIFVMEPFLFTPPDSHQNLMPFLLQEHQILKELCSRLGLDYIPLQDDLSRAVSQNGSTFVTVDGIHPATGGCQLLANAWIHHCLRTFPPASGV